MALSEMVKAMLANDRLVQSMTEPMRQAFLEKIVVQRIKQGETVYRLGDPAGGIYFIVHGGIRVEIATGAQNTFIAHYVPKGHWFGEPSALTGQPRMVGVIAAQDSELLHIGLTHLNQVTAAYPEVLRLLAGITQMYLRTAIGAIADLIIRDTDVRFIAILMRLAGIRDVDAPVGQFEVFFSQEEIAAMANVARTTANAILRKLEDSGVIEITYRRIVIIDPARLRARMLQDH